MKLFYVGAGPSPRLLVRSGDRPNHLGEGVGASLKLFAIRRRRACLGRWALMLVCVRQLDCC